MAFNILAMDGGMRPLMMIGMLDELECRLPGFISAVDLFAGTSAGAMTAAFMTETDDPVRGLQRAREFWSSPENFVTDVPRSLVALTGAVSFSDQARVRGALFDQFGDKTLGDLKKPVLFASASLDNESRDPRSRRWTMRLFNTLDPIMPDSALSVVDAVMRSSSTPIMSPTYQGYADGGLFANNPSLCGVTAISDYYDVTAADIRVVSIGHGQIQDHIDATGRMDGGYQKWLLDPSRPMALLRLVFDTNLQVINYQCGRLLEDRYVRVDPELAPGVGGKAFDQSILSLMRATKAVDYEPFVDQLSSIGWFEGRSKEGRPT